MSRYLLFLIGGLAFAGQSIQLSTATASNSSIPAQTPGRPWRVEFSIHDWGTNYSSNIHGLDGAAVGANIQFLNLGGGDLRLQIYSSSATGGSVCQIPGLGPGGPGGGGSVYANLFLIVRFEEDPAAHVDYCQAWDINGTMVLNQAHPYTDNSNPNSGGATVGGLGLSQNLSTAYFRIYTDIVPTNARPPVTADVTTNCLVIWKFDQGNNTGSLRDLCSHGYNASMSSGSPTYVPTPGQGLVVPVLKTSNAPVWGNGATVRAGFPALLDGTSSYSQADSSATVNCFWQVLGGPTPLIWGDPGVPPSQNGRGSCRPKVQGFIFGDYKFQLVVTDMNNVQATASQDIGAVATDSNGVVVNADPNVDFLFGPMIALGSNPWGYQDYWHLHASGLRYQDYVQEGWIQGTQKKPQWEYTGQGTVSYYWNCVGKVYFCNQTQYSGTTSGPITVGAPSFNVSTIAGLDLTSFPTHLILYTGGSNTEVRICSSNGTILTVCYDGWGGVAPQTFPSGTPVLQAKVTGSGTRFLTDPNAPVCPLGPGLPGPSQYSIGTVTLTPNSTAVTGSGTAWSSAMTGSYVQVASTHSSMPFTFIAQISAVNSGTSITLSRAYPADADAASGVAYNIMNASRTIDLRYPHLVDGSGEGQVLFGNPGGCESETAVYLNPVFAGNTFATGHDLSNDGAHYTGETYSVTDSTGWVNQNGGSGGISFYGESLAHRSLYYRSGLTSALTAADAISDYWIKSPWGNRDINGISPLWLGGEAIGSYASAILEGRVSWSDLRSYAASGIQMAQGFASRGCNAYDDTRDSGYAYSWLILAAIYDPDTTSAAAPGGIPWRRYWQNNLAQMQTDDMNCQNQTPSSNNSFANAFYWNNTSFPALTVTNGSATATGTGLPSSMCPGTAQGTATVTNGSATITILTGSVPAGTDGMFLTGTSNNGANVLVQNTAYGSGVLGELWPGDSGVVTWISTNVPGYPQQGVGTPQMMVVATGQDDLADMQKNWSCIWNSSTSITLNRPWDGASSDSSHVYYPYVSNLAGYGQQPFMLGIKSLGENWLATQTVPELGSYVAPYQTVTQNSTSWIWNTGMDHSIFSTDYGRVFQQCEPDNSNPPGTIFSFRAAGCTYGNDPTALYLSHEQNSETGAAHAIFYQNNPTAGNRLLGDQFYGALWGFCPWTAPGAYCASDSTSSNASGSNLADGSVEQGKWFGFFAGIGMSSRWPATRLGGVQPPQPRTVQISTRLADIPGSARIQITVTAPSGATASFPCASQPCAVTVDDRQGSHWYKVQYLSADGKVLSESQPDLLGSR